MLARLRRAMRLRNRLSVSRSKETTAHHRHELEEPGGPPDVLSVRAKSSRHGKSTADKWNQ